MTTPLAKNENSIPIFTGSAVAEGALGNRPNRVRNRQGYMYADILPNLYRWARAIAASQKGNSLQTSIYVRNSTTRAKIIIIINYTMGEFLTASTPNINFHPIERTPRRTAPLN